MLENLFRGLTRSLTINDSEVKFDNDRAFEHYLSKVGDYINISFHKITNNYDKN